MNLNLDNKVIIVSGGSKGIGLGIVDSLIKENAIHFIIVREEFSIKIAKFFKDNGIKTHFLSKDKNILGQWNNTGILILDTFGDLPKFYRNSKYVYVGGG